MTHQVNEKLPDFLAIRCFLLLVKLIKINSRISGEMKRVVRLPNGSEKKGEVGIGVG